MVLEKCAKSKHNKRWYIVVCLLVLGTITCPVFAWGPEGHGVIGVLAIQRLDPQTREKLEGILGSLDEPAIIEACNWPDKVRKTGQWEWSSPFHYVNIPQGDYSYQPSRDCPNGQCLPEALKNYAIVLGQEQSLPEIRQQAFNWVCHLTGDLHQPLHAGYASDRGGNDFEVQFGAEAMNLHAYWDFALIRSHYDNWHALLQQINTFSYPQPNPEWTSAMVDEWTNESHELVTDVLYPANPVLDLSYQQTSWEITQQQLNMAASRLAAIIESILSSKTNE